MKRVAIIDYGSGNLRSAAKAFERAGGDAASVIVTSDPKALKNATHIVLPGVGAFADCMRGLEATSGMRAALEREVREKGKPFLGVCVGMQMLFQTGHEHGMHKGLGWLEGEVVKIESRDSEHATRITSLKIPHMGWNDLRIKAPAHPLLSKIKTGDHAYFVHSYHALAQADAVLATTDYGDEMVAVVGQGNILGTQFHPEKSQAAGLRLIGNFLTLS